MFWILLYIIDGMFFIYAAFSVLYMLFYSIASIFSRHNRLPNTNMNNRFIVIIPAYKQDAVIENTVKAILAQTYPQRFFDVVVVSDHENEMTNFRLAQYPITLLTPDFQKSSKAKSLNYAMDHLPAFKIYDVVLVLDADNLVDDTFLENMNKAYELSGTKVIQAHRVSQNRDTSSAILDSIFEEINNSIFRRGHVAIGISSAITGSGIALDFNWFKKNVKKLKTSAEDKELEALILDDQIFVDYFNEILVYDKKTQRTKDFSKQRGRWMSSQFSSLKANINKLIPCIFTKRYDYADKIIQWMIMPRTVLVALLVLMSVVIPFIYMSLAIKWWILFAILFFAFAIATPDYLVDKRFDRAFIEAPFIMLGAILNVFKIGRHSIVRTRNYKHRAKDV